NCQKTYAVQVKTNASTFGFWLVNKCTSLLVSEHLVYAFVNLRKCGPEFYIVPSAFVAEKVIVSEPSGTRKSAWYSVYLKDIAEYKNRWTIFENPSVGEEKDTGTAACINLV